jgi:hypothetical protein
MSKKALKVPANSNPKQKRLPRGVTSAPLSTNKDGGEAEGESVAVQPKLGRPSKYTPEVVEKICERLSKGEPLAAICRDEDMPSVTTMWQWEQNYPIVSESIARARSEGEDFMAADCLNIADDNGQDIRYSSEGFPSTDHDVIQRAKLRIDTRLKLLAKWNPKKWGEKVDVTSGGESLAKTRVIRPAQPNGQ